MSDWSEEYRLGYIHGKSKGIKKGLKMRKGYVRVVRCKDCKYFDGESCCGKIGIVVWSADWYCADGERQEK